MKINVSFFSLLRHNFKKISHKKAHVYKKAHVGTAHFAASFSIDLKSQNLKKTTTMKLRTFNYKTV